MFPIGLSQFRVSSSRQDLHYLVLEACASCTFEKWGSLSEVSSRLRTFLAPSLLPGSEQQGIAMHESMHSLGWRERVCLQRCLWFVLV